MATASNVICPQWQRPSIFMPVRLPPALASVPDDPNWKGHEDGAINHDHYIYGGPRKWIKRKGQWVEAPPLPEDYYTNPKSAAKYDRMVEEGK